jgi:hypothetical protein
LTTQHRSFSPLAHRCPAGPVSASPADLHPPFSARTRGVGPRLGGYGCALGTSDTAATETQIRAPPTGASPRCTTRQSRRCRNSDSASWQVLPAHCLLSSLLDTGVPPDDSKCACGSRKGFGLLNPRLLCQPAALPKREYPRCELNNEAGGLICWLPPHLRTCKHLGREGLCRSGDEGGIDPG